MKYVFYANQLDCGHSLNTETTSVEGVYVYCPTCGQLTNIKSSEIRSQEIDDIEELPE